VRALFHALSELKAISDKGNKSSKWSDQEDQQLKDNFANGLKTSELAKMHRRSSGAYPVSTDNAGIGEGIKQNRPSCFNTHPLIHA
jgi:hypothetical protein